MWLATFDVLLYVRVELKTQSMTGRNYFHYLSVTKVSLFYQSVVLIFFCKLFDKKVPIQKVKFNQLIVSGL